jgi:hypothetical protein
VPLVLRVIRGSRVPSRCGRCTSEVPFPWSCCCVFPSLEHEIPRQPVTSGASAACARRGAEAPPTTTAPPGRFLIRPCDLVGASAVAAPKRRADLSPPYTASRGGCLGGPSTKWSGREWPAGHMAACSGGARVRVPWPTVGWRTCIWIGRLPGCALRRYHTSGMCSGIILSPEFHLASCPLPSTEQPPPPPASGFIYRPTARSPFPRGPPAHPPWDENCLRARRSPLVCCHGPSKSVHFPGASH